MIKKGNRFVGGLRGLTPYIIFMLDSLQLYAKLCTLNTKSVWLWRTDGRTHISVVYTSRRIYMCSVLSPKEGSVGLVFYHMKR